MTALDHCALPLARYRLEFQVRSPLRLPAYAGSALRGAWGSALRAASCVTQAPQCDGCPLLQRCPYAIIFETRPPEGAAPALQAFSQTPKPYVIEPPSMGERAYQPGETLAFHIVLAGRALDHLALILWAYARALGRGVGPGDGTARLLRVVHEGEAETVVLEGSDGRLQDHAARIAPAPAIGNCVTLRFHTPLRLQSNGRRATVEELTPRRLLMALVRRVALVCEFHGAGPLPLDFTGLARSAEAVQGQHRLRWADPHRYSSRQQRHIPQGGWLGDWTLQGALEPFAPFLHLGQWLHVGKEATFGLGGYRLLAC